MQKETIRKEDLVAGGIYRVNARNFGVAIWTGKAFRGSRSKFDNVSLFDEYHWDDGPPFGTASPFERLGTLTVPAPFENNGYIALLEAVDIVSYTLNNVELAIEAAGLKLSIENGFAMIVSDGEVNVS